VAKSFVRKRLARLAGIAWVWLFGGAIVLLMCIPVARGVYMAIASSSWVPTAATVLAIESQPKSAELKYEYAFGGARYTGDTFAFLTTGSLPDKDLIEGSYRVGDRIEVFVNPANPAQSVVVRRPFRIEYVIVQLLVIVFIILVGRHILVVVDLEDLKKR
jgi:hypothetical protein